MRRDRRVKIVATLGPASNNEEMMRRLFEAGADVFRVNMSHTAHEGLREVHAVVRKLEAEFSRPIGILIDLQGPKLRIGKLESGAIKLTEGDVLSFVRRESVGGLGRVHLPHPEIFQTVQPGHALLLDDDGVVANTLRWPDEFVRHKALDCVGDLALAGRRLRARIVARRPSHRGTVSLVRELVRRAEEVDRVLGIDEIMRTLPHRYPFLLVDRILEYEEGKRVVGLKNVTINEPFFQGHFPGHAIMPGVLIIEAMAQVGGMLLMATSHQGDKVVYFTSLDNVKWRKPVRPGDQLRFELDVIQIRGVMCKMRGVAKVDGQVVAEADMAAMLRDR